MVDGAAAFLPNLIAAIILLIIGLVVGKIVGRVVKEILVRIKLDYYVTESHKPVVSLADVLSVVARWWIYVAFITVALSDSILGVPALSAWTAQANSFIAAILGASAIILVGYALGDYVRGLFARWGPSGAFAGKVLYFAVLYVSVAIALPVLGLAADLVQWVLLALIAGTALAFALAVGLGAKDTAGSWARAWAKRSKLM
jgi:hypothetical protein